MMLILGSVRCLNVWKILVLLTGCGKECFVLGLRVWPLVFFYLIVQMCPFSRSFWEGDSPGMFENFPNLKGCIFVYVPRKVGHEISVIGTKKME
jgi:hypothetical protein